MSEIITYPYGTFEVEGRCSGQCCKIFNLCGLTMKELQERIDEGNVKDGEVIKDMLIELTIEQKMERRELYCNNANIVDDEVLKNTSYFTCKHLSENGDCSIYENRPHLCRSYPYCREGRCEFKGCTLKVKKIETQNEIVKITQE
jgi:Fe-S-cluster containining protein